LRFFAKRRIFPSSTTRGDRGNDQLAYARRARIVDGDDGRVYVLELSYPGHLCVMRGTMDYQHELIFEREQPKRHADLMMLFVEE
jgi:hypothetical protein